MTTRKLFAEFNADEYAASAKYLGRLVLLSGVVAETSEIEGNPYVALVAGGTLDLGARVVSISQTGDSRDIGCADRTEHKHEAGSDR